MGLSLNRLNLKQREAVLHTEGPLLILAGAGSGKTSTMSYRIAHLIADQKVPASKILGLSFTNKAARELRERVIELVSRHASREACKGITISTFHSLCARLLREFAPKIGYTADFTIVSDSDQTEIVRKILKEIRIDDRKFDPQILLSQISRAKNLGLTDEQASLYLMQNPGELKGKTDYQVALSSAYGRYQASLRALNAMDFDDLQLWLVRLLEKDSEVRERLQAKFRYVHVDEYQDTNPIQFRILELLTAQHRNLCVVGDDDQSIYAWRGADPSYILGFAKRYDDSRAIILEQNYRSTQPILDAANEVISKNCVRHQKELWSERESGDLLRHLIVENDEDESETVAEEILKMRSNEQHRFDQFAVLFRSNAQSRAFEEAFRRHKIPYKLVGAMSFLDRKEIKDLLSYWRLILNPADDLSARRVINWPARGVGRGALGSLNSEAASRGIALLEALRLSPQVAPKAARGALELVELVTGLREDLERTPKEPQALAQWALRSMERIDVRKGLQEDSDQPAQVQARFENLEELAHSMGRLDLETPGLESSVDALREFLQNLALDTKEDKEDDEQNQNQVTLMTLHSAKGLEFPIVFLAGMEEGFLPHWRTLQDGTDLSEERRLCYVGMTRAKDRLILSRAKFRTRYGKQVPRTLSRFIQDVPSDLIELDDRSSTPDLTTESAVKAHEDRVKGFLDKIRARL